MKCGLKLVSVGMQTKANLKKTVQDCYLSLYYFFFKEKESHLFSLEGITEEKIVSYKYVFLSFFSKGLGGCYDRFSFGRESVTYICVFPLLYQMKQKKDAGVSILRDKQS